MDPLRHAFFLLLFTSILAAEPGHARAAAAERQGTTGTESLLQRAQRLVMTLKRTIQSPTPSNRLARAVDANRPLPINGPQVSSAHPVFQVDDFRLPPPAC